MNFNKLTLFLIYFWIGLSVLAQNTKEQVEFEAVFSKKNSEALTKLVNEFESSLQALYKTNLALAYQSYFREIESGVWPEIWTNEEKNKLVKKYLGETGVWNEIWIKADSSWTEGKDCYCRYSYKDLSFETRSSSIPMDKNCNCEILPNKYGLYFKGLKTVSDFDKNIWNYLDAMEIAGMISPSLLAGGLSHNNEKYYENYCIKRIILLDVYLHGYVWK